MRSSERTLNQAGADRRCKSSMAKPKRSKSRSKPPARADTYEIEEEVPHEEKYAGQRYDVSYNDS